MQNEVVYIAHKNLVIDQNMRKVAPSKQKDRELIAMIKYAGVLQNLIVAQIPGSDRFAVGAGGRRTSSVKFLISAGDTIKGEPASEEYLYPCRIVPYPELFNASVMENSGREDNHPADEFMAFKAMADKGLSVEEIAATFGKNKRDVSRLLKLSSVSPKLVEIFRAGKLSLDAVMAFSITEDHEKQLSCYEGFKGRRVSAEQIREILTEAYMDDRDPLARFVTMAAYRKAGGRVESDLFEDVTYVVDVDLMKDLATEKLEKARLKASDGWKWAAVVNGKYIAESMGRRLKADFKDLPEALVQKLEEATQELDAMDCGEVAWSQEKEDKLEALVSKLESERESYRAYTDKQRAKAGCALYLDEAGQLITIPGIVRAEDEKPVKNKQDDNTGSDAGTVEVTEKAAESRALQLDLDNQYHQGFQAAMVNQTDLAFDLLVFSLACSTFVKFNYLTTISAHLAQLSGVGIEDCVGYKTLLEAKEALPMAWMDSDDDGEQFAAFQAMPIEDKRQIMTFCVARCMKNPLHEGEDSALTAVSHQIGFNVSDHWQATGKNYFGRIDKKLLLKTGDTILGDGWADDHAKMPKGQLVDLIAQDERVIGWVPEYFINN